MLAWINPALFALLTLATVTLAGAVLSAVAALPPSAPQGVPARG